MWKSTFLINKAKSPKSDPTSLYFERMEPKILLSADALSGFITSDPFSETDESATLDIEQSSELLTSSFASPAANEDLNLDALSDVIASHSINDNHASIDVLSALLSDTNNTIESRQEIIFVDAATPDYQQLLDGLTQDTSTQYQVHILHSDQDGIEQMSTVLNQQEGIDAIHLISHGNDQGLQLGDSWLSNDNLSMYNEQLQQWSSSLDANADLLIYGCELASSEAGLSLINGLAELTGVDIGASDDLTGAASLGGDWDLEHSIGELETQVVFTASTQHNWSGLLATVNLNATQDSYVDNGSPTSNFGSSGDFFVDKSGGDLGNQQALLQFDLSSLPAGAVITSATLNLEAKDLSSSFAIDVYEVTASWDESSVDWSNKPSTAAAAATLTPVGVGQHSWDITSLAQAWANGSTTNNGILLGSSATGTENVRYYSSDDSDPSKRPELVITYTAPVSANDDSTYSTDENDVLSVSANGVLANDTLDVIPAVTSGATLEYLAWEDKTPNLFWENESAVPEYKFDFAGTTVVLDDALVNAPAGITSAYVFDGSGGGQLPDLIQDLPGDPTNTAVSFEFWIRPTDAIGQEIIFDTGAIVDVPTSTPTFYGDGASLHLNGSTLEWVVWDSAADASGRAVAFVTQDISAEIASGEFINIVAAFNPDDGVGKDNVSLWVNGVKVVGSAFAINPNVNDWSSDVLGSATTGIGAFGGGTGGTINPSLQSPFVGEIASLRIYDSELTSTEVQQNFDAMQITVVSHDVKSAAAVAAGVTAPNNVIVNADGSFEYDPGTLFDSLAVGDVTTDTFTYTVEDSDGNQSTATVTVTIHGENDTPTIETTIPDQTLAEDFTGYTIDLNAAFADMETVDASLVYSVTGNTNINVSITNGIATITSILDWSGNETLTFRATDAGGLNIEQSVLFTVNPDNDTPTIETTIPAQTLVEDFTGYTIDLNAAFADVETVDASIVYSVTGNTNINVSITNGIATITPTLNWSGNETLTFRATDAGGLAVVQTVLFTVNPDNDTPTIETTIPAQTLVEDFTGYTIDLNAAFADVETVDASLVYSVTGNTNINVSITNGIATITPTLNWSGNETLTFRATDAGGLNIEQTVLFTVNPDNDTPTIETTIPAQTLVEDFTGYTIDLNAAFADVETVNASLVYSVTGNTNINVSITNGIATITSTLDWSGNETLTFRATDAGGLNVEQSVLFTVNAVNDAPTATNLTDEVNYSAGDASVELNDIVITDLDNGEIVTATLSLLNVEAGELSASNGATYNAVTGVWEITGSVANVNQALAEVSFIPAGSAVNNTSISVVIDDGDEDSSGALLGALTINVIPVDLLMIEEVATTTTPPVTEVETETEAESEVSSARSESTDNQEDVIIAEEVISDVAPVNEVNNVQITDSDAVLNFVSATESEQQTLKNNDISFGNDKATKLQSSDASVERLRENMIAFNDPLALDKSERSYFMKLDDLREEMLLGNEGEEQVIGSSLTVSAGFSVGYVVWLARSGVIMSSVLSSLPAWRFVDPLPVLGSLQQDGIDDDEESLESMVGDKNNNEQQS